MELNQEKLKEFLTKQGIEDYSCKKIAGDCSFRSYYRIESAGKRLILMFAPPSHEDIKPFIEVGELLLGQGLTAPKMFGHDFDEGFLLLSFANAKPVLEASSKMIKKIFKYIDKYMGRDSKIGKWRLFRSLEVPPPGEEKAFYKERRRAEEEKKKIKELTDQVTPHLELNKGNVKDNNLNQKITELNSNRTKHRKQKIHHNTIKTGGRFSLFGKNYLVQNER